MLRSNSLNFEALHDLKTVATLHTGHRDLVENLRLGDLHNAHTYITQPLVLFSKHTNTHTNTHTNKHIQIQIHTTI